MTKKADEQTPQAPVEVLNLHKGDDYRSMYINWVQPSFTVFDISVLIGEASNRPRAIQTEPATVEIEMKARLVFHPAEARIIALLLLQSVAAYEKQVGPVPIPPGMAVPQLDIKTVVGEVEAKSTEGV